MTTFREQLKTRFAVFGILVVLVLGMLLVRLWSMQILSGTSFAAQAKNNRTRILTIDPARGSILDRNHKPLVTNSWQLAVTAEPSVARDKVLVGRLSSLLAMGSGEITHTIIASRLAPLQPRILKTAISMQVASYLAEHAAAFPGVAVEQVPVRTYPQGSLAAHVLGYAAQVSDAQLSSKSGPTDYRPGDIVGKTGAEAQFESVLRGDRGFETIEVDAKGRPIRSDPLAVQPAVGGRDVELTIDSDVQRVAEDALVQAIDAAHHLKPPTHASAGAAVVLDVTNGEILALASNPTYDPSAFVRGMSRHQWRALTNTKKSGNPLQDRAISAAYPPASTFKAITGLAGLQTGAVTPGTSFDCTGTWTALGKGPGNEKKCWDHSGHGLQDFTEAVINSCDVYFYNVGLALARMRKEPLQAFAVASGYGAKTDVDLPGEVAGRVPTAKWRFDVNKDYPELRSWTYGDTVNLAIGQGDMLATPLQEVCAFAGIANGGKIMQPHILKAILDPKGKTALTFTPKVERTMPVSQANLHTMQNALAGVVTEGTAKGAFAGFSEAVAGKTGSAQVFAHKQDDYAWFVGYAPVGNPKYAVAVLIEQGGHGGSIAGPAARMILAKLAGQKTGKFQTATDQSR